jgi:organic radical activating enzyme
MLTSRKLSPQPTLLAEVDVTTEVELELTNRCNAACVACPRDDMPAFGLMAPDTLDRILGLYEVAAADRSDISWIARRVTLAGGGDPLIHPSAPALIERISQRGFSAHLITNAAAATDDRIEQLMNSGLTSIAVSFWGIKEREYEHSMKLPFERTLRKVERLADRARDHAIPLTITWVRAPTVTSTRDEIGAFWAARGIAVDASDNEMWNRGGLLRLGPTEPSDELLLPDPRRGVWCADLFLSDTWSWNGLCLMCCCNYFTTARTTIGNIDRDSYTAIKQRKREILSARPLPSMCQQCLQPRSKQANWLAQPVRSRLSEEEWQMLTYASPDA